MATKPDQRLMRLNAEAYATERAEREGVTCYVYRRVGYPTVEEVTWYVRTDAEGEPVDAVREFTAEPAPR